MVIAKCAPPKLCLVYTTRKQVDRDWLFSLESGDSLAKEPLSLA
jgi:hypothetical protein